MQYMHKLFYNLGDMNKRKEKLNERLSYDSIILPNLQIKPMNQPQKFNLYYIPTMHTMNLINDISKNDVILMQLYNKLPDIAQDAFLIDILSSELQSTNEMEGVKSSKEEIVSTTKKIFNSDDDNKNLRFFNAINSYFELQLDNLKRPKNVKDIRKIYDEITKDGVYKKDFPDGSLFRMDDVYVKKLGKIIHEGVNSAEDTEEYIILTLEKLLYFLNTEDNCNSLVKNAIFHYYFGYIHPFYDGNGRTNRFISSIYLKEDYSWITAFSLSQGCNENRNIYLKSFDQTNQVSMQGELNFFIDSFLEILDLGQTTLKENLSNKITLLEFANENIKKDSRINSDKDLLKITKIATELHLFGNNDYIDVNYLVNILDIGEVTIRKKLNKLTELKILTKISKNPIKCVLNKEYLEQ